MAGSHPRYVWKGLVSSIAYRSTCCLQTQRKYIGAQVVNGVYTLSDPTETAAIHDELEATEGGRRPREGSISSASEAKDTVLRMPPSLTLSKIRSVKQQALMASVKAKLEVSTVALSCVYFERLCLDCRVDKSNRRLSFAACLLLAAKINESHVALVMQRHEGDEADTSGQTKGIQSLIRPTKKGNTIFESLLEFFTHEWSISLSHLFAAEWGVFAVSSRDNLNDFRRSSLSVLARRLLGSLFTPHRHR